MKKYDVLIIGGGVSGAAAAYEFSKYDFNTALIEKENDVACGSTKANSALIHAGFDPEYGTLMAKYNARGNELAHEIAGKLDVPFEETGSLVLAFDGEQQKHIEHLKENGDKIGVKTELWTKEQVRAKEQNVSDEITGALWAPTCGIISPWEYTAAMCETAVLNGVEIFLETRAERIAKEDGAFTVWTNNGALQADYIVNAAGLYADAVHEMAGGEGFRITPARGEYYLLDKPQGTLVSSVIFQCPTKAGKGVVVGPTVHGNLFLGPDNRVVQERDDTSTHADELRFIKETALKSVPVVDFSQNIRNFAGLRAVGGRDFIVGESPQVKRFFNIAGIKSPGLTSAPAIAEDVLHMMADAGLNVRPRKKYVDERHVVRFAELSAAEQAELVRREPLYGRVVCRCQTITEGEILAILRRPLAPRTMDGIKRRCSSGMGRCQGGFCEPRIHTIIAQELGMEMKEVLQDLDGSYIITGMTKEAGR